MIIDLPPGVVNLASRRSNMLNWREVHLVRWDGPTLRPVGGWEVVDYSAFASPIRAIHKWTDNSGVQHIAYLCEEHCYVDSGSGLVDITPVGGIVAPPVAGQGGYGDGTYGTGTYGTPRDAVNRLNIATPSFTLDNWGQELRAMTSADGRLLRWDPDAPSTPLTAVAGAPTGNRTFSVTAERHIMLFGTSGSEPTFSWSDEEDDGEWTPGTTTKAGSYSVEPAAAILAHHPAPGGQIMFTSRFAYSIQYIGLPYVYNYDKISNCPPPYSPASITEVPVGTFWAALNGFWVYNGVSAEPVECPIWDWVKNLINVSQSRFTASMINVKPKFEVWWFFAGGSGATVNNYVVIYNYRDNKWSMGVLGRTCGLSVSNDENPIMANSTTVFKHEAGFGYPGADKPWAETFTLNSARGGRLTTIMRMLPELIGSRTAIQFKIKKRNDPTNGPETTSTAKLIKTNGYVDVRETARDLRIRLEMIASEDWSMGPIDVEAYQRGKK